MIFLLIKIHSQLTQGNNYCQLGRKFKNLVGFKGFSSSIIIDYCEIVSKYSDSDSIKV